MNFNYKCFFLLLVFVVCHPWENPKNTNEKYEILFNQPSIDDAFKIKNSALDLINNAKFEIHFAISSFNDAQIAGALIGAQKKGVTVNVYFDEDLKNSEPGILYLRKNGFKEE